MRHRGPSKVAGGSGSPAHSPALNDRHPEGPGCQQGGRLSPVLGSGSAIASTVAPEPWEWLIDRGPRFCSGKTPVTWQARSSCSAASHVSELLLMQRALPSSSGQEGTVIWVLLDPPPTYLHFLGEGPCVRASSAEEEIGPESPGWGLGTVGEHRGPSNVAGGSGGPAHSPALNDRHPEGPGCQQCGRLSPALGSGVPNLQHCGARALGIGTSAGDLGFVQE